jgi:hypothetical protein
MGLVRAKVLGWTIVAVLVVGFVIWLITFIISNTTAYTLQGTLPKMIADFGANARVVEIDLDREEDKDQHVLYDVIGADGQLHQRSYVLSQSPTNNGGTGSGTYVRNAVRMPTAAELSGAQLHLGQIPPGVVDELYGKVGFPSNDSHITLTGETWALSTQETSGDKFFDRYEARYDGSELRQTRSAPFSSTGTTTAGSPPPPAPTPTTPSAPTVRSPSAPAPGSSILQKAQRLLACVQAAHQDVTRLTACQRRFGP